MLQLRSWMSASTFGALFSSSVASAAEPANSAVVRVTGAEPGMSFEVAQPGRVPTTPRCIDPCQITAPLGKYELHVYRGDQAIGTTRLKVYGPASFEVSPPNLERQKTGLALGITGSAFILGGFIAVGYAISERHDCGLDEACRDRYTSTVWYATGAVALGAVLSPIGWVLFGTNRNPKVKIVPEPQGRAGASVAMSF